MGGDLLKTIKQNIGKLNTKIDKIEIVLTIHTETENVRFDFKNTKTLHSGRENMKKWKLIEKIYETFKRSIFEFIVLYKSDDEI